jgi:hypothetical protein
MLNRIKLLFRLTKFINFVLIVLGSHPIARMKKTVSNPVKLSNPLNHVQKIVSNTNYSISRWHKVHHRQLTTPVFPY